MIRPATNDDIAHIVEIEAILFPDAWTPSLIAPYLDDERVRLIESRTAGHETRVAVADGAISGYLLAHWVADEGSIDRIAVPAEHQRQGIARALLDSAFAAFTARGVHRVWLEVGGSNAAAIRLYESMGFVLVARRRGYYAGPPPDDALVMRRDFP